MIRWVGGAVQHDDTMKNLVSKLLLLCALASFGNADEPLRVLCYNIHHCEGVDGKLDLNRIARVIQSVRPDIVALQEVDANSRRSDSVNQPTRLADLVGMHVVFGANIQLNGGGHYGNAVLSKFPIQSYENHSLPNTNGGEQRGVLACKIQIPGISRPLVFLATHFDHRKDDAQRFESAQFVNKLISDTGAPAILAGDMNDVLGSRTLYELQKRWRSTTAKPLPTIPVAKPERQIDFILYRPANTFRVKEVKVLDERVASDHRAIFAVIDMGSNLNR